MFSVLVLSTLQTAFFFVVLVARIEETLNLTIFLFSCSRRMNSFALHSQIKMDRKGKQDPAPLKLCAHPSSSEHPSKRKKKVKNRSAQIQTVTLGCMFVCQKLCRQTSLPLTDVCSLICRLTELTECNHPFHSGTLSSLVKTICCDKRCTVRFGTDGSALKRSQDLTSGMLCRTNAETPLLYT